VLVLILAGVGIAMPSLLSSLAAQSTAVRASAAGIMLFLLGLLMGQAFPLGMRLASANHRVTLWLWGVNGAMSVCASVLAVVLALAFSISTAFWTGCACYLIAWLAASRMPNERLPVEVASPPASPEMAAHGEA
jgi:hypothetical protein